MSFPDYYNILNVPPSATSEAIRSAYKKESLKSHPDRLANASPSEKKKATEKFQTIADAYYILSDPKRRAEYDDLRAARATEATEDPAASSNFFANFANMFGGAAASNGAARPDADDQFANVFDDLLRPEVDRSFSMWSWFGAASGAGLGFIIANIPGALVGGVAGNRLGAIRDAKGKSVAAVFGDLGANQKAEILRALAFKVLGSAL